MLSDKPSTGVIVRLSRRQSRCKGPVVVTHLDFVDNIALLSELINQPQDLLAKVELPAGQIGPVMNAVMASNHDEEVKINNARWVPTGSHAGF